MDQLFNATVVYSNMNSLNQNMVQDVVARYNAIGGYSFQRNRIEVTTDANYFKNIAGFVPSSVGDAVFSANVDGQHTIWIDPNKISPDLILHEFMHGTHPGLGSNKLHLPEFYLSHGEISAQAGIAPGGSSPSSGAWYSGTSDGTGQGSLFAHSVAVHGLTDAQLARLEALAGVNGLQTLSLHLQYYYGGQNREKVDARFAELTGKPVQELCFLAGTPITLADGSVKAIEDIVPGDLVQSYDKDGALVPGRVTRTFVNDVDHVLDVFGLMVTPGHVTLCGDGVFDGQHVPIIDILRSDGALVREDGSKMRAATGADLGGPDDRFVEVIAGRFGADGNFTPTDKGRLRAGTRMIFETGQDLSISDLIAAAGGTLRDDGLVDAGETGLPFLWPLGDRLPRPEDYVMARSRLSVSAIYAASEWEGPGPLLPAPGRSH